MFMRFVHVKVKPESMGGMRRLYNEEIIPALHATKGCLYASLIQGVHHADECISMTLWETPGDAAAYEQGGVFAKLLHDAEPFFADSSEWKVHLTTDLELTYETVREEPVVDAYHVPASTNGSFPAGRTGGGIYVRIVSPQVRPGKMEEFKKLYTGEILPVMRSVKGCRYAAIIENAKDPGKVLSISIWDSKQDADDYEISGLFDNVTEKVKHTFSELYQWKMQLEKQTGRHVVTSDEITVEGYSVVTGRSFL